MKTKQLKVAVLGPIPYDRVTTHRGEVFEKYGCALYTTAALSALLAPDDSIHPLVHVRRSDEAAIKSLLSQFVNVESSGVSSATNMGDVVELDFVDQNKRIERQTGFMAPLTPEDVEPYLDADAFVCVPITDYEVSLATLKYIKENSNGIIVLDAHGPTATLTQGGERRSRLWVERDMWLPYIDILKMNLEEAGCSWFPPADENGHASLGEPLDVSELPAFAEHCLRQGVGVVSITLDESGCAVYTLDGDGNLVEDLVDRLTVEHVVDTTGCGDSFAAGLAYGFVTTGDPVVAARYGNAMGAQRCASSELAAYLPLVETDRQIALAYNN